MNDLELPLVLFSGNDAFKPFYATSNAAGADLFANLGEPINIIPGSFVAIPTGIKLAIPGGWEGQVRPRSGLARKKGITLLNSPGTIDSDFRGEIEILLVNHGKQEQKIRPGDRIAQLVIVKAYRAEFKWSSELSKTQRGHGGFGFTGR